MMKKEIVYSSLCFIMILASCSPKMVGTWDITKYENKTVGGQDIKVTNIGTMSFKKDHTGVKQLNYSILSNQISDSSDFKWNKEEETITITGEGSQLNKTWIIIEDGKKNQKWKSTDGSNTVQVIELKKK